MSFYEKNYKVLPFYDIFKVLFYVVIFYLILDRDLDLAYIQYNIVILRLTFSSFIFFLLFNVHLTLFSIKRI